MIDKTKWKVVYVDSELADQNLGVGENLYDGDVSSFWHTAPTAIYLINETGRTADGYIIGTLLLYRIRMSLRALSPGKQ